MLVQENGSIEFHLIGGETRIWQDLKIKQSYHEFTVTDCFQEKFSAESAVTHTTGWFQQTNGLTGIASVRNTATRVSSAMPKTTQISNCVGFPHLFLGRPNLMRLPLNSG